MNEQSKLQAVNSRVDLVLGQVDALYNEQRNRVLSIEANYQKQRTALTCDYARRMNDIAHDGAEALRVLDEQHRQIIAAEEKKLDAIRRLRG